MSLPLPGLPAPLSDPRAELESLRRYLVRLLDALQYALDRLEDERLNSP